MPRAPPAAPTATASPLGGSPDATHPREPDEQLAPPSRTERATTPGPTASQDHECSCAPPTGLSAPREHPPRQRAHAPGAHAHARQPQPEPEETPPQPPDGAASKPQDPTFEQRDQATANPATAGSPPAPTRHPAARAANQPRDRDPARPSHASTQVRTPPRSLDQLLRHFQHPDRPQTRT